MSGSERLRLSEDQPALSEEVSFEGVNDAELQRFRFKPRREWVELGVTASSQLSIEELVVLAVEKCGEDCGMILRRSKWQLNGELRREWCLQ